MRRLIVPLSTIWLLLVTTPAGAEPKVRARHALPLHARRAGSPAGGTRDLTYRYSRTAYVKVGARHALPLQAQAAGRDGCSRGRSTDRPLAFAPMRGT
jgi:hypothetical protein